MQVRLSSVAVMFWPLGNVFSDEKEVVDYVRDMVPLICLFIVVDSFQAVLSGNISELLLYARLFSFKQPVLE